MILKNWKPISFPPIPDNLNNKLLMVSNVVLNQNELNLFYLSINWISEQIKKDNIEYDFLTRVTCIFTDTNEPTIVFDEDNTIGVYSPIILYRVNIWRKRNYTDIILLGVYLEELCHCYYHYEEEVLVKHKVIEILSSHIQNFQPTDLYTKDSLRM